MKDILFSLCTVSLFSSFIMYLTPSGQIKKSLSLICSLVICLFLITPTVAILKEGFDFEISLPESTPNEENNAGIIIAENTLRTIERSLENEISEKYEMTQPKLTLKADCTDLSNIIIVSGTLSGSGKGEEAAEYLSKYLKCDITYEGE